MTFRNLLPGGRDKQDEQPSNRELGLDGEGRSAPGARVRESLTGRLLWEGDAGLAAFLGQEGGEGRTAKVHTPGKVHCCVRRSTCPGILVQVDSLVLSSAFLQGHISWFHAPSWLFLPHPSPVFHSLHSCCSDMKPETPCPGCVQRGRLGPPAGFLGLDPSLC